MCEAPNISNAVARRAEALECYKMAYLFCENAILSERSVGGQLLHSSGSQSSSTVEAEDIESDLESLEEHYYSDLRQNSATLERDFPAHYTTQQLNAPHTPCARLGG